MHLLGDPSRMGALRADGALLRNRAGVWPVLGGLPVLVPDPAGWLAAHRDAVLAALAEVGRLEPADLTRLDAFALAVRGVPAASLPDDFLADEEPSAALHDRLASYCDEGPILEVGCGAGALTRRIRGRPFAVVDRSPRALLRATRGIDAVAAIGLAEALPVRRRSVGTLVAANVIDLLDDPDAFLERAFQAVRPGGTLVLSTPDPAMGIRNGPDGALAMLVEAAGFVVEEEDDGIEWVRVHSPRHREEYVVRLVVARRRS